MATFTAYLDESGKPDDGILSVAGYVSKAAKWKRFSEQWNILCKDYEVPHIHLIDAVNPKHATYRHLCQARRRKMLMRAAAIISKHVMFGCTTYISTKEYDELMDAKSKTRHGSAYGVAVGSTVIRLISGLASGVIHTDGSLSIRQLDFTKRLSKNGDCTKRSEERAQTGLSLFLRRPHIFE